MSFAEQVINNKSIKGNLFIDPQDYAKHIEKYNNIVSLGGKLHDIKKALVSYVEQGELLCNCFTKLKNCFDCIKSIDLNEEYDPKLSQMIMEQISVFLRNHVKIIKDDILNTLDTMFGGKFDDLNKLNKEIRDIFNNYDQQEEKYLSSLHRERRNAEKSIRELRLKYILYNNRCYEDVEKLDIKLKGYIFKTFTNLMESLRRPYKAFSKFVEDNDEGLSVADKIIERLEENYSEIASSYELTRSQLEEIVPKLWEADFQPIKTREARKIHGYLYKKCSRSFPIKWARRFFSIQHGTIYYSSDIQTILTDFREISLLFCSVKRDQSNSRPNCFVLTSKDRSYVLQASTEFEMQAWINAIKLSIEHQYNTCDGMFLPNDLDETNGFVCADCGAKNVTWCSINLGLTLCEECCGIHRGLSASVSKVRGLNLDEINYLDRLIVDVIGSEKANDILEKKLYTVDKIKMIKTCSSTEERESFIRQKYVDHAFLITKNVSVNSAICSADIMDCMNWILGNQNRLNEPNEFTPLHISAIVGNPIIFALFSLNSKEINPKDDSGWTPLMYAIYYENVEIVEYLLSKSASVEGAIHPYLLALSTQNNDTLGLLKEFEIDDEPEPFYTPPHPEFKKIFFQFENFVNVDVVDRRKKRSSVSVGEPHAMIPPHLHRKNSTSQSSFSFGLPLVRKPSKSNLL